MSIKIGHASISEKGSINGKSGDQTGKEVCTRSWYSKPWNVMLVCTDKEMAKKASQEMQYACDNNNIGYGQSDRRSAYDSGLVNGKTFKKAKGNTDCSQLVASCYIFAGLKLSPDCYTGNLRKALLATGKFKEYTDSAHLKTDAYAEVGAVYLKEGSHVVMALEDGSKTIEAKKQVAAEAEKQTTPIKAGKKLTLKNAHCYTSSTAKSSYTRKSGTYYVWSEKAVNGRIRITNKESRVGVSGQVTCWIDKKAAE